VSIIHLMCCFITLCVADPIWGVCCYSYTLVEDIAILFHMMVILIADDPWPNQGDPKVRLEIQMVRSNVYTYMSSYLLW